MNNSTTHHPMKGDRYTDKFCGSSVTITERRGSLVHYLYDGQTMPTQVSTLDFFIENFTRQEVPVTKPTNNTDEFNRLSYALAKQVPDMVRGFTISTTYGDIDITEPDDAEKIAALVKGLLERRLLKEMFAEDSSGMGVSHE
ncbi:MAG: hypothetical protein ACRC5A_11655 [Enterobacteriaceae bacterium]